MKRIIFFSKKKKKKKSINIKAHVSIASLRIYLNLKKKYFSMMKHCLKQHLHLFILNLFVYACIIVINKKVHRENVHAIFHYLKILS